MTTYVERNSGDNFWAGDGRVGALIVGLGPLRALSLFTSEVVGLRPLLCTGASSRFGLVDKAHLHRV